MKPTLLFVFVALYLGSSSQAVAQTGDATEFDRPSSKPNVVILLIDDAALMDLGVYGGEARTPNIDALAVRGAMFTNYRSSPLCAPSRAMLLTGVDNHRTGIASIPKVLPPEHKGKPGYTMCLEPGVLTIADRLRTHGYRTIMTGKWHLGHGEGELPDSHGFDRSFALDASGADNWEDKPYMPYYDEAPWFENGEPADLPEDFYSSKFLVDKAIEYLGETDQSKPFLAYIGFQAVHVPVQAPQKFTAHYKGVYEDGWEALQTNRVAKAKELGLISSDASAPRFHTALRKWESQTGEQRKIFAARMEVYAGMLEAMDHHVGRLIEHLKSAGQYENTIFVATSDNGTEPSVCDDPRMMPWMKQNGYHFGLEGIGERGSYGFIGPEFASAASGPSYLFKFYTAEGGLRVPLIIAGPGVPAGKRIDAMATVRDVTPTLLNLVDAESDKTQSDESGSAGSVAIDGRSLVPLLAGKAKAVYGPDEPIGFEVSGNSALYRGEFKLVRNLEPFGDGQWRLYNISSDPGETHDLSEQNTELLAELIADYQRYAKENGVLEMPPGYSTTRQVRINTTRKLVGRIWPKLLLGGAVVLLPIGILIRVLWKRRKAKTFASSTS